MVFVEPKTYLVGYSVVNLDGLLSYLEDTDQKEFLEDWKEAQNKGLSEGECLCSFYAKLCYKSLTTKHNKNISKIRGIWENLCGTYDSGHGSVFEHCYLNFTVTNCSRVFTHELVRHRIGTSFSQTSGRYVRGDEIGFVHDPILDSVKTEIEEFLKNTEEVYQQLVDKIELEKEKNFDRKKKITSALRRILPNGQSNEIGFGVNLRQLRHMIMVRTSRHAEWEIRKIFNQIYDLTKSKFPLLYYGAKEECVEGILEITGLKTQPY